MKYYETHFDEYIVENLNNNLHPKLEVLFDKFPKKINQLTNLIFYGPSGVGKYTQILKSIKKYSNSGLKYEKKISVLYNKQQYFFKISDIHYEIDMSLLGCNSKMLWYDIYQQIIDILSTKSEKSGIILCKNFQDIQNELLEIFYSYMQQNFGLSVDIKFIIITNEISFIPDNILNCCEIVNIQRASKTNYMNCFNKKKIKDIKMESIYNNKLLKHNNVQIIQIHKIIVDKILNNILHFEDIEFLKLRDLLYDIFIYNLDITNCIWYILSTLINEKKIKRAEMADIMIHTYRFFQYYNNNYRPIFHLENYLFYLISKIHSI